MPDILPPDFWNNERDYLAAILYQLIEGAALDGVDIAAADLAERALGFDNAMPNAQAAAWARAHTDDLLNLLGTTSERVVGEVLATWIEMPGGTMGDLTDMLARVLSLNEYRAAMIATTETTRAYAAGNDLANQEAGIPAMAYRPGDSHPYCRCWSSPAQLSNGDWVVLWQTNRDEIVCRQLLQTPMGQMMGCRDLHNRVISQGRYLGMALAEAEAAAQWRE